MAWTFSWLRDYKKWAAKSSFILAVKFTFRVEWLLISKTNHFYMPNFSVLKMYAKWFIEFMIFGVCIAPAEIELFLIALICVCTSTQGAETWSVILFINLHTKPFMNTPTTLLGFIINNTYILLVLVDALELNNNNNLNYNINNNLMFITFSIIW